MNETKAYNPTVHGGSRSRWRVPALGWCSSTLRQHGAYGGVAVAPGQLLSALVVCVVGEAGGVATTLPDEEGASLGGDEGGILRGEGRTQDGTAAAAGICGVVLRWYTVGTLRFQFGN